MKVYKINWYDHKPSDDNDGLIYGLENETQEYIEWFGSDEEREEAIKKNNFKVKE